MPAGAATAAVGRKPLRRRRRWWPGRPCPPPKGCGTRRHLQGRRVQGCMRTSARHLADAQLACFAREASPSSRRLAFLGRRCWSCCTGVRQHPHNVDHIPVVEARLGHGGGRRHGVAMRRQLPGRVAAPQPKRSQLQPRSTRRPGAQLRDGGPPALGQLQVHTRQAELRAAQAERPSGGCCGILGKHDAPLPPLRTLGCCSSL